MDRALFGLCCLVVVASAASLIAVAIDLGLSAEGIAAMVYFFGTGCVGVWALSIVKEYL